MTYNTTRAYSTAMEAAKKLGRSIKRIRMAKGISQGDIARMLNIHKGYISNIENGKVNPTLTTLTKLAKAIKVPLPRLFGEN